MLYMTSHDDFLERSVGDLLPIPKKDQQVGELPDVTLSGILASAKCRSTLDAWQELSGGGILLALPVPSVVQYIKCYTCQIPDGRE